MLTKEEFDKVLEQQAEDLKVHVEEKGGMSNGDKIWNCIFLGFIAAFIVACHHMEWYVMASVNSVTFGVQLCTTIKSLRE